MAGGIVLDAAPGERQLPGVSRLLVETGHVVTERLHRCRGIVAAGIGEQNDKFVPTLPGEDIGLTEGRFHQIGDGDQRAVTLFMPPGIIDVLEAVEVDKGEAYRLLAALGRQQGILRQGEEPRRLNSPVSSSEVAASSTLNSSSTIAARSLKICISWAENERG